VLTVEDRKKMPRKTLSVVNPHSKKTEVYQGVLLEELLRRAKVPQGEQLRGRSMATYIVAEAQDDYRVVCALAELDSGILDSEVIVADTVDDAPLAPKEGPFRLVAACTMGENVEIDHGDWPSRTIGMIKSRIPMPSPLYWFGHGNREPTHNQGELNSESTSVPWLCLPVEPGTWSWP
jgi:Oxidoreductase molybdopterin binding domain